MKNLIKKGLKNIGKKIGHKYPNYWLSLLYLIRFKKKLNLKNPKNLNEKILYLSLKTDTTIWSKLSDKYAVRDYVTNVVGEDKLVHLYGKWEKPNEINFNMLPNSFVLKTNHGSGDIIIVKDKNKIDQQDIKNKLTKNLKPFYGNGGEKHYERINPLIIAEQLLENDDESKKISNSIIDYKCWCFNGKCEFIWVCINRNEHGAEVMTYDRNWISHPEFSVFNEHYSKAPIIPKPKNLDAIIETAEKLAKPFPVVRTDLYLINNKVLFGELTFTSLGGLMNYFTNEFLELSGNMIDLKYKHE